MKSSRLYHKDQNSSLFFLNGSPQSKFLQTDKNAAYNRVKENRVTGEVGQNILLASLPMLLYWHGDVPMLSITQSSS
jgi:hypothetical protein